MNTLYYGDNLQVLREHIKDESVDLIYLDPPFNSNANYNVLFAEQDGSRSASQIAAFEDTWQWDQRAVESYQEILLTGGRVADIVRGFHLFLGESNFLAYLVMMAPRLVELYRVLKPTGSLYLHCDPTASHYLKIILDTIFGVENFRNEITWKRTSAHGNAKNNFASVSDIIFYYSKSSHFVFNKQFVAYSESYLKTFYRHVDKDGRRYRLSDLRNPGYRPNLIYDYKGYKPHPNGWAVSKERMEEYDKQGRLYFPKDPNGRIQLINYLDDMPGMPVTNLWDDIQPIGAQAAERLGYPTQKPVALLERIIQTSSNPGDIVLDPFCGCGTAVAAAQKLGRTWIGIDITHLAISLIKRRLADSFGDQAKYQVIGEPASLPDARKLAEDDPYQFQWWALSLVGARPVERKKGADAGIDGRLYFIDDNSTTPKQVIFSVKAGKTAVDHIRDLRGVLDREQAQMGVLICMQEPTKPMRAEAASAGFYTSQWGNHPRIQILTIEELLDGQKIDMPPVHQTNVTYRKAPKTKKRGHSQLPLGEM